MCVTDLGLAVYKTCLLLGINNRYEDLFEESDFPNFQTHSFIV